MPADVATHPGEALDRVLSGLDHLELAGERPRSRPRRVWSVVWPKLAAAALFLGVWQLVYWSGWKPEFLLPSPRTAFGELWDEMQTADFWRAAGTTMRRALVGFALAISVGAFVGVAVTRLRPLRVAIGSMITGLQTMPSVAWFPLAILVFGLREQAILFVVVLGAAPSIANGIIAGIDTVPPILRRVGRTMGARGVALYRDVIVPAALPSMLAGLKQGWAFSWRSLMAGELLVLIPGTQSIGSRLEFARQFSNSPSMVANMIVIFAIGVLVDALLFGAIERDVLRRRGLTGGQVEPPAGKVLRRRELAAFGR